MRVMTENRPDGARRVAALVLALTLAPAIGAAPAPAAEASALEVTSRLGAAPPPPDLRVVGDELRLTLEEAVRIALQRNLGLNVVRYDRQIARLGIDRAMGIYDLALFGGISASHDESPAASNLDGADVQEQDRTGASFGVGQLFPSGGSGSINWSNGRFKSNSQFSILNPSFTSGMDFSFAQPLLRGFGRPATEYGLEIARNSDVISRDLFLQQVISTLQRVENAYWGLVEARYQQRVAEESLQLAQELHQNNQTRVDVGTLAPLELVSSEAGIATREEEIIRARAAVADAEDQLRWLLNLVAGDLWDKRVVPETEASMAPVSIDLAQALETALATRSELAVQRSSIRGKELDAAFYRQELKPSLDLKATYGFNGVGGDVVLRDNDGEVIDVIDGGWGDALEQMADLDFPGWSVALEFSFPLQNRAARARSAIAEVELEQGQVLLSDLEQKISTEVRTAVRNVETSRQQIQSAAVSVRLAEKNLDAERKKYENGLSTTFQILQVQEDVTAARSRQVSAVTGYRRALVEYQRAIGKLLDQAGVHVAD
jgi:outer membrane protein TolC